MKTKLQIVLALFCIVILSGVLAITTNATTSDTDGDADGIPDSTDNCPMVANPDQADADSDGVGDACDTCPNDANNDADGDGVCGDVDNCPFIANPDQADVCSLSNNYAKTAIIVDGEMSSWEWNDAAVKKFWFVSDEEHPDDYIYLYTKNDDKFLYILYDVVPDNSEESCSSSGCDWAKLAIARNSGTGTGFFWGDGSSYSTVNLPIHSWSAGFVMTPNADYAHRVWEFKVDLQQLGVAEGDTLMVTMGGYGTLSLPTGEPWTFPEWICTSEACTQLENPATYGADLTLVAPFNEPTIAWSFTSGEGGARMGSSFMDLALFDQNGVGYMDLALLTIASDASAWCADETNVPSLFPSASTSCCADVLV